jgi:hypothetical protein
MANPEHVLHQWLLNGQPKTRLPSKAITGEMITAGFTPMSIKLSIQSRFYFENH